MCGIIAFISKTNKVHAGQMIINQYQNQHERGNKGFGLMEITKDKINVKRATEPTKALLDATLSKASVLVFHHRQPTSSDNTIKQTHPFLISHDELKHDYYLVHNGVLSNEEELFKKHTEEFGYVYQSFEKGAPFCAYGYTYGGKNKFNDSESLAIEIARYMDGLTTEIDIRGSAAFIVVRVDKKTGKPLTISWGKNGGNPIEYRETEEGILIASSILGDKESVESDRMFSLDIKDIFLHNKSENIIGKYSILQDLKFKKEIEKEWRNTQTNSKDYSSYKDHMLGNPTAEAEEDLYYGMSQRERAFAKMGERMGEEMQDKITDLFAAAAYTEISLEDIASICTDLEYLLLEKSEKIEKIVRPYFDKKEERESGIYEPGIDKEITITKEDVEEVTEDSIDTNSGIRQEIADDIKRSRCV